MSTPEYIKNYPDGDQPASAEDAQPSEIIGDSPLSPEQQEWRMLAGLSVGQASRLTWEQLEAAASILGSGSPYFGG